VYVVGLTASVEMTMMRLTDAAVICFLSSLNFRERTSLMHACVCASENEWRRVNEVASAELID